MLQSQSMGKTNAHAHATQNCLSNAAQVAICYKITDQQYQSAK